MRLVADGICFGSCGPCCVYETRYPAGGARALVLMTKYQDPEDPDEELVAVATVNVEGVSETLPDDHVVIKDYSLNEGTMDTLVEAGIVEDTGERAYFGYVSAPIGKVLL